MNMYAEPKTIPLQMRTSLNVKNKNKTEGKDLKIDR